MNTRPTPRFWMVLGSVMFFLVMAVCSYPSDEEDHVGPFGMGFMTAVLLAVAWTIFGERQNPRWRGKLRGNIWDHESGQLGKQHIISSEGRIPWVACVRYSKTQQMEFVKLNAHFYEDDLYYDEDVHVLPYRDGEPWNGLHEFSRSCSCLPEVMEQNSERTIVIHVERDLGMEYPD